MTTSDVNEPKSNDEKNWYLKHPKSIRFHYKHTSVFCDIKFRQPTEDSDEESKINEKNVRMGCGNQQLKLISAQLVFKWKTTRKK